MASSKTAEEAARQLWVDKYTADHGGDRDDLMRNPGTLFQLIAWQVALYRAMAKTGLDPASGRLLDIGCGGGTAAGALIQMGFAPDNLYGIDLLPEHIADAKRKYSGCHYTVGDGRQIAYPDGFFDVALEFGVFIRLPEEQTVPMAREMARVLKPGGFVLLIDWRYGHPTRKDYYALSKRRRAVLFSGLEPFAAIPGALLPPVGRALSAHASGLYFLVQKLLPPLVGQFAWLLRKPAAAGQRAA
jgi:SAM-dependent methyltransferase